MVTTNLDVVDTYKVEDDYQNFVELYSAYPVKLQPRWTYGGSGILEEGQSLGFLLVIDVK